MTPADIIFAVLLLLAPVEGPVSHVCEDAWHPLVGNECVQVPA